jgi:hypothetical protein
MEKKMDQIKSTPTQFKKLLNYKNGVGFIVYKTSDNTTTEFEFYIKDGQPHHVTTGKKV